MGFAYLITHTAEIFDCPDIAPEAGMILEIHMVEDDVIMDMPLIYVGGDYVLVFMVGESSGELYTDLMSLLRGDLSLGK